MNIKHGIMVIDPKAQEENMIAVAHFCGYESVPQQADFDSLKHELFTDPEFGLVGRDDLILMHAPKQIVDFYVNKIGDYEDE